MFRVKVNSILLPQKIVFALNSSEAMREFVEGEIVMVNLKIALDALKLADRFLESTINSLTKMTWYAAGQDLQKIEKCLHLAQILSPELHKRINDSEKLFIFFLSQRLTHREYTVYFFNHPFIYFVRLIWMIVSLV